MIQRHTFPNTQLCASAVGYSDEKDARDVVCCLWRDQNPKKFITYFNKHKEKLKDDSGVKYMWLHIARAYADIGNEKKASEWMKAYIDVETDLTAGRSILEYVEKYEYLNTIVKSKFNEAAVLKYKSILQQENVVKTRYIQRCKQYEQQIEEYMNTFKR